MLQYSLQEAQEPRWLLVADRWADMPREYNGCRHDASIGHRAAPMHAALTSACLFSEFPFSTLMLCMTIRCLVPALSRDKQVKVQGPPEPGELRGEGHRSYSTSE